MLWDIFCKVIDNHGDIGVCWRLASQLAEGGEAVRLWADNPSALSWMAPPDRQGMHRVEVKPWHDVTVFPMAGDVVIEAFGCAPPDAFIAGMAARSIAPLWINLEYLSAESFAERAHGLRSPVMHGPGRGLSKRFFYPGFTPLTGGLLREPGLQRRQDGFDAQAWLRGHGIEAVDGLLVSLFCYEPAALDDLLVQLAQGPQRVGLLVTAGRASAAVAAAIGRMQEAKPQWNRAGTLSITLLPLLSQIDFDHLLWACDLNFVRGEDSLVRALWAGRPFVWQIYPQDDGAHRSKLSAFLDWLDAPASLRVFHADWNGLTGKLGALGPAAWTDCVLDARHRLLAQEDLVTQLLRFTALRQATPL